MGERVNISYSVDIDELDVEVQRLIKSALVQIQHIVGECNSIDQAFPLTVENTKLIESIRVKLAKADIIFGDVNNIINGYLDYKTNVPVSSDVHEKIDDLNELKQKIESFKDLQTIE